MAVPTQPTDDGETTNSLERHLMWLYGSTTRCRCEHALVSAGRVDRINMGRMWARTTTHPNCPEHGTTAQRERTERLRARR